MRKSEKIEQYRIDREAKTVIFIHVLRSVIDLLRYAITALATVAVFYFIKESIDSFGTHFAGEVTEFYSEGFIKVTLHLTFLGVGTLGIVYGKRQSILRKNTIERLQSRIQELEKRIDENRSSSGLTSRGDTNPRDRS